MVCLTSLCLLVVFFNHQSIVSDLRERTAAFNALRNGEDKNTAAGGSSSAQKAPVFVTIEKVVLAGLASNGPIRSTNKSSTSISSPSASSNATAKEEVNVLVFNSERFFPRQPIEVRSSLSGQTFCGVVVRVEPSATTASSSSAMASSGSPGHSKSSSSGKRYASSKGTAVEGEVREVCLYCS